jgi:hypothetical protein
LEGGRQDGGRDEGRQMAAHDDSFYGRVAERTLLHRNREVR